MTRCRSPKFCERYKIEFGIQDHKGKKVPPRSVKQNDKCLCIHKNQYCVIWKKK